MAEEPGAAHRRGRAHGADLGIAFDGDADRIGVVDDEGHILFGDQLLVVLARDVLKSHPGGTIIADVKASQVLFDEVAKAGGTPLMWKTGHSLIKSKMAETGSAAGRRDVRPHLLRRQVVRLRRRALFRGAPARHRGAHERDGLARCAPPCRR